MPGGMWGVLRAGSCDNPLPGCSAIHNEAAVYQSVRCSRSGSGGAPQSGREFFGRAGKARASVVVSAMAVAPTSTDSNTLDTCEANLSFRPLSMLSPSAPTRRSSALRAAVATGQRPGNGTSDPILGSLPVPLRILAYPSVPVGDPGRRCTTHLWHGSEGVCREPEWPSPSITTRPLVRPGHGGELDSENGGRQEEWRAALA